MKKNYFHLAFIALGIFVMLGSILLNQHFTFSISSIAKQTSQNFSKKSVKAEQALLLLSQKGGQVAGDELQQLFEKEKIGIYLFKNDTLVYWNNSQIPIESDLGPFLKEQGLVKLKYGFYLYRQLHKTNETLLALCLIKPLYEIQNNYLKNDFSEWSGIPKELEISSVDNAQTNVSLNNENLFSLKADETQFSESGVNELSFALFLVGFLVCLVAGLVNIKIRRTPVSVILFILGLVILRALMIYLKWPSFFYKSSLYDVRLFGNAQSLVNAYLGDILFNALVLLSSALALHLFMTGSAAKTKRNLSLALLFAFTLLIVNQFNQTLISIVSNSTLNFDFLSIFNIKFQAFVAICILSIYSITLFVVVHKSILFFNGNKRTDFVIFFLLTFLISVFQQIISGSLNYFENFWLLCFSTFLFLLIKLNYTKISLGLGFQILIMSIITSVFLNFYISKNQKQELDVLSLKLSERQDATLESEFATIPAKIFNDESLANLINILPNSETEIKQLLKQKFFGGYFNRYNVDFSLFDSLCHPLLIPKQALLLNEGFFEDQIAFYSDSTFTQGLFFVKDYRDNARYIGKIKLKDKKLYVLLEPKQVEELGSFPDLLLDQSQQKQEKLKNLSYAVYRSGQKVNQFGEFNFPVSTVDSLALAQSNPDFVLHFLEPDDATEIIISQATKTWTDKFTYNSYLFLFFSIVTYCSYFFYNLIFTSHFKNASLTRRIQTIIIVLLLLAMSAVGITSANLVIKQFETDNKKQLREKTEIIINELAGQFKTATLFDEAQKELVNLKLKEYARLFNTDISLFNKNGFLFNTSQPKLYDLGLAATVANPAAFWRLKQNQTSSQNVNEKAGTLNFLSRYTPLFDSEKKLVGFINLPYFSRQSDLVNELSGIISALINVYVILFVISILAGLILSGYITQPLRLIKQQIANISLGKQNEKITWQSSDEIGKLVSEYNQMLVKLEESANLLAQSERESAWREMAKQVAHEIKNPLTPMKLNLQYMQHLMKNNPDDFKEKFEKTSSGIIEQIDTLANIANEFSNFAKLPGTQLQTINVAEIISSSVSMFENQKSGCIENTILQKEILIKGDKDQCLRVFNNVLKNAMQAIDETPEPKIRIHCELKEESLIISINDNGCGISEALKPRIFTPNFTTKTTGSGLGLAMVKNSMQGFGGKIWFESEPNSGTTFYLEFKKAK